ncbi:MAG: hypothetical protein SGILL_008139, partial [Bacillariaceae sp.]
MLARQIMVYVALTLAAVAFGISIYILLSQQEQQDYKISFYSFAREITEIVNSNAAHNFGQFRGIATGITSHAISSGETFPNVVVPFFDKKVSEAAMLTGAQMVLWVPLVEQANKAAFELGWMKRQAAIESDYAIRGEEWDVDSLEP